MFRKVLVALVLVSLPTIAIGARLRMFEIRTGGQFVFDVMVDSNMGMSNGLRDAYDGCYMLRVGGRELRTLSATILYAGRGLQSPRIQSGDIFVSRQVYVPEEGDWARYFDLFINNTKASQTVEVEIYGNLGSDSSTKILGTSDGDNTIETTDSWFATDDYSDGSGDPSLAHVFRRGRGKLRPESVQLDRDSLTVRYRIKLRPRKRAALVFFAVQTKTGADAQKIARDLSKFGTKAKARLHKADIRLIAN